MNADITTEQIKTEEGGLLLRCVHIEPCSCGAEDCIDGLMPSFFHLVAWKERPDHWVNILSLDAPDAARLDAMIMDPEGQRYVTRLAILMGQAWGRFEDQPIEFISGIEECMARISPEMAAELVGKDISEVVVMRHNVERMTSLLEGDPALN